MHRAKAWFEVGLYACVRRAEQYVPAGRRSLAFTVMMTAKGAAEQASCWLVVKVPSLEACVWVGIFNWLCVYWVGCLLQFIYLCFCVCFYVMCAWDIPIYERG